MQSVHFNLCEKFADAIERKSLNHKLLSDSTLMIENAQFRIGRGGNGTTIYIGYHLSLESWVAIKCCVKAYINVVLKHTSRN